MNTSTVSGLASVIIPCWNQLEFTKLCIRALVRHTRRPWELIAINNGSTDGTGDYLAGVQDGFAVPVAVIANERNRGFPTAINQGLQRARGEYLALLNNDVVVTHDWLEQLIALANAKPPQDDLKSALENIAADWQGAELKILDCNELNGDEAMAHTDRKPSRGLGMVGPMSNYACPPQLVENVPYQSLDEMHVFAQSWRDEHLGKWFNVCKLSGFCLLMKRAVYEEIGGLDEQFGLGFFDDDDLAERARRAGFELAVARDLFIHHFGSRTFAGNGVDAEKMLNANAERFADKWGTAKAGGRRVALKPFTMKGSPAADAQVAEPAPDEVSDALPAETRPKPRISLTMIVKNEETNLPNALESVRGLFDEIVVVDTGSTDRTVEIARSFGARVFDFPWVDDFAAARNAALARATGDYALWLDADDVVEAPEREKLEQLLAKLTPLGTPMGDRRAAGYVLRCACDPSPDGTGGDTVVDHVRLFPVREGIRWTYRVHEQILPALNRARIPVRWTDITIRHTGYVDQALRGRKLERDSKILLAELEERPDEPFVLFNLGALAGERKHWALSLEYLRRSLALSRPTDSITRKLYALIARAHQMRGAATEAIKACNEGLAIEPDNAELLFRKAVVLRHCGHPREAEACWREILKLSRPRRFCSVDQGIYGHLTRRNLAALAAERCDRAEEETLWSEVLAERPDDREALTKLATVRSTRQYQPA